MSFLPNDYEIPKTNPSYNYKPKVLELIARALGDEFSGHIMVSILKSAGVPNSKIEYPNTKWKTILGTFNYAMNECNEDQITVEGIIEEFLDPLSHNADEEKAKTLSEKIHKLLKYSELTVIKDNDRYRVFNEDDYLNYLEMEHQELDEKHYLRQEEEEKIRDKKTKNREKDLGILVANKEKIQEIKECHQAYIDLLEVFCNNSSCPTDKLNSYYIFLKKHLQKLIDELRLNGTTSIYIPFKSDLYSAEKEWGQDIIKGPISWDKIRPELYSVHSWIAQRCNAVENHEQQSDNKKKLAEITNFISETRTVKTAPKIYNVKKMEILHKYENKKASKKTLKNSVVKFDDTIPAIFVDEVEIPLPEYGKEHYFCRAVWKRKAKEAIDWSKIYNDMEGKNADFLPDKELWRYVYDAKNDVNKRVKDITGTTENLFDWKEKTIKRLY